MPPKGWENISLKQEWVVWIDSFLASHPEAKSRTGVVETALQRLKDTEDGAKRDPPATRADLEKLRNEFRALAGLPPKKRE